MTSAVDTFFDHYYRRRPVSATLTGVHDYDALLPDWSPAGIASLDGEMRALMQALENDDDASIDAGLARDFLEIQLAENASGHGVRGNPSLWTGEAIFSVVSLMIRDFAPRAERIENAVARLSAIPDFLRDARATLGDRPIPDAWTAKAVRECEGGGILFTRGIDAWIAAGSDPARTATDVRAAAARADTALGEFAAWLGARDAEHACEVSCGPELYDQLLAHGHRCARPAKELLADAKQRMVDERARLDEMASRVAGSWSDAQGLIAARHPAPAEYLDAFGTVWTAAHDSAVAHDLVSWPDWPIRYTEYPAYTREAAPYLYYLHYRSPAPFDPYDVHDYVVPALPPGSEERHLRTWNDSVVKLNHVVHHGGIGHHVQNWFAYHRAPSRIGQVAAVDCANRIGMFCGATMAEGWATYVTGLMDEVGFLTPLDQLADQHSRLRFLARAIVDIELHQGAMSLDDAVRFYTDRVGMSADAARGEAVKNSMYPGTAIVYWLGTQSIRELRSTLERRRGGAFSLKGFHDEFLSHGSIPVPLIARLMTDGRSGRRND